jgi:hypothetical protein
VFFTDAHLVEDACLLFYEVLSHVSRELFLLRGAFEFW